MVAAQALLCLLTQVGTWEFDQRDYINTETQERRTAGRLYDLAVTMAKAGRTDDAAAVFGLISENGPDEALKERALFKRAEAYWSGGSYQKAHHAYAAFVLTYPESEQAAKAKEQAMWCALRWAEMGKPNTVFGLFTISHSSSPGIELLRDFLRDYPREKFSAKYRYMLAEFLKRDGEIEEAETELANVVEDYPGSPYAAKSLIRLAETQMEKFDGLDYDIKPLREAYRHYQRFLDDYKDLSADLTKAVKAEQKRIRGLEAQKQYRVAEYYLSHGYPLSAEIYFRSIKKNFADTEWARKAAEWLEEEGLADPPAAKTPPDEEKK